MRGSGRLALGSWGDAEPPKRGAGVAAIVRFLSRAWRPHLLLPCCRSLTLWQTPPEFGGVDSSVSSISLLFMFDLYSMLHVHVLGKKCVTSALGFREKTDDFAKKIVKDGDSQG